MRKINLFVVIVLAVFFSCDNDNDPTNNVCEENYVLESITNAFSGANGYGSSFNTMDLETHEYVIQINANGEICSVGYQNPNFYTGSYIMSIENHNNPAVNYSGNHTFSQTNIDYQSINPVAVNSGDIIRVRRTIVAGYSNLNQTIGPVIRLSNGNDIPYPIAEQNVTFISSDFYDGAGPGSLNDFAQPIIGLGFKVN